MPPIRVLSGAVDGEGVEGVGQELAALRRENQRLRGDVEILKWATASSRRRPVNSYPFIEAQRAQRTVKRACELLEVSRAAYYAHRTGNVAARHRVDEELTEHIRAAHQASKGRYGAPRIHAHLRRRGHRHSRKRVARLMRAAGLRGQSPRRFKRTTILTRQRPPART